MSSIDACWTVVAADVTAATAEPSVQELKTLLEKGKDADKVEAMKRILAIMVGREV